MGEGGTAAFPPSVLFYFSAGHHLESGNGAPLKRKQGGRCWAHATETSSVGKGVVGRESGHAPQVGIKLDVFSFYPPPPPSSTIFYVCYLCCIPLRSCVAVACVCVCLFLFFLLTLFLSSGFSFFQRNWIFIWLLGLRDFFFSFLSPDGCKDL